MTENGEDLVFEGETFGSSIPLAEVPHVVAQNRVIFESPRHRVSLREIRAHSHGIIVVLDRVFRRLPVEDYLAYRVALMDSYAEGTGALLDVSAVDASQGNPGPVVLDCVLGQGDETRNASFHHLEYWCPGEFSTTDLHLSLRETSLGQHLDFHLPAAVLRNAQAQVFTVDSDGFGFPEN